MDALPGLVRTLYADGFTQAGEEQTKLTQVWPSGLPTRGIANPDRGNVTTLAGMSPDEGALCAATRANGVAPSQVALAWLLWRSPVMLPIPGTSSVEHLEENVAAAAIELDEAELEELSVLSS